MNNSSLWFLLAWLTTLVIWDAAVLLVLGPDATISAALLRWSQRWPALPLAVTFALGILIGHLFWPQRR